MPTLGADSKDPRLLPIHVKAELRSIMHNINQDIAKTYNFEIALWEDKGYSDHCTLTPCTDLHV